MPAWMFSVGTGIAVVTIYLSIELVSFAFFVGGDHFLVGGFETDARRRSAYRNRVDSDRGYFCGPLHRRVFPALKKAAR